MPNYPASLDALANPNASTLRNDPGFELHAVISTLNDIVEALEAKLGIGASAPGGAAAVLRRTASGASAWGQVVSGDIAPQTIVGGSSGGASNIAFGTVTGGQAGANTNIAAGTIVGSALGHTSNILAGSLSATELGSGLLGMRKIGEVQASGSSGTLEITGIPSTYRSLRAIVVARSSAATTNVNMTLQFEATPTAGYYYHQRLFGSGSTASASENAGATASIIVGAMPGATSTANLYGASIIDVPEYSNSSINKPVLIHTSSIYNAAATNMLNDLVAGVWLNFTAPTQITLKLATGNFLSPSRLTLYGISG